MSVNEHNIDDVKKYWNKRPCNILHSSKEIGTKEYFDEVERKKFFVEPHILSFTQFETWKDKEVLEIGCGIGTAAINFAKHGASYTGIDLSEESLNLTKKRFEVYNLNGNFYCHNAESLTQVLNNKKFDLIYSFGVIHHTPNPSKVLCEIKNLMHKDSIIKIMIYAKNSWKNAMIECGFDQPEAQESCPIAFTYTHEEAKNLLCDFDIIDIYQDHIFPYDVSEYKKGNFIKTPWFQNMPQNMFNAIEKKLGWHLLVTAKLKIT